MTELESASLPPVVDDSSFEAWEASQPKAAPAQQPKAEEKSAETSVPQGQTAAVPETAKPQEQQKQQAKPIERKRDAESTIHKKDRELAELRKQLEEARKNAATPQDTRPAPETPKPANEPPKLGKLSEYVKAEHSKRPDVLQEDLIEEWVQKREAEAEQSRQAKAGQERITGAMRDFRAKHPDVADDVFGENGKQGIILGTPQVNVMKPLMDNFQNWPDVLHYLHENPDVYQQVRASSPQEQWFDVIAIARQLSRGIISVAPAAESPAQEQPRSNVRPISRVPAPAKHVLGGGMPPEGKTLRDARDFEEAEAIEKRRTAGGR